jgi:uncharacterized membrane protein YcjF (UPF0283 family)
VKPFRAGVLALMILFGLAMVAAMTAYGISTFSGQSLVALGVVIVAAIAAGIAFSIRRYFPRRR